MTSNLFHRIVVPTDFSGSSEEAWVLAQRVAGTLSSEVVLAHVDSTRWLGGTRVLGLPRSSAPSSRASPSSPQS